ncbi:hypothetical protein KY315_04560, partial [Candidatus Woesearchaeota archaeon]|nr:hypothetical protein [Candidatus Woesearchaeota archaeon]
IEFGDSPANIAQYDVGPDCLFAMTQAFSSSKGRAAQLKEELDKAKVGILAKRHEEVGAALDEAFGGEITINDLSLTMMQKLVNMRARYETEAKQFMEFLQEKQKSQEEIRNEFRGKYRAHLDDAVSYLNNLPADDLRKQVQNEIARTQGKDHAMGKLLKSGVLSDEDREIVEQIFNTTNELTQEQYARANVLFRMHFPRNLMNSYGSLIFDIRKRHEEGAIPDEVFARISHLVKDPRRKATGEECMLLRWADPEDTIKVRMRINKESFEQIKNKYDGIDPINSLRRRLIDFYEQDRKTHAEAGGRAKQENCVMKYTDYQLVRGLVAMSSAIANADVKANPKNFQNLMFQVLSRDQFEGMIGDLSVLARKASYNAWQKYQHRQNKIPEENHMQKHYVGLDKFLDAAGLSDIEVGALATKLGIEAKGRTREPLSEEIALSVIDRVCNTLLPESRFCDWQAANRSNLLLASNQAYQIIDKKIVKKVLEQYEKVAIAKPLPEESRKALTVSLDSGLVDEAPGINRTVQPYAKELRYEVE